MAGVDGSVELGLPVAVLLPAVAAAAAAVGVGSRTISRRSRGDLTLISTQMLAAWLGDWYAESDEVLALKGSGRWAGEGGEAEGVEEVGR